MKLGASENRILRAWEAALYSAEIRGGENASIMPRCAAKVKVWGKKLVENLAGIRRFGGCGRRITLVAQWMQNQRCEMTVSKKFFREG